MRDKMIRDRRKSGKSVSSSIDTHLDIVVGSLEESFADRLLEGETMPDFRTMFRLFQRTLDDETQELVDAGALHLQELDNDITLRQRRDELVESLGTKVSRFREALSGLYGPGRAHEMAGIVGRTEQEPVALLAQVERILDRFGDPEAEIGPPSFGGFQMDPSQVIEQFRPDYLELNGSVTELNRENRKSDATLIAKNEAVTRYDRFFRWIACGLESFYHLANQHELAERVKPSTRRPGRTQADVEEEQQATVSVETPATDEPEAAG